jgi:hypothetical protein
MSRAISASSREYIREAGEGDRGSIQYEYEYECEYSYGCSNYKYSRHLKIRNVM